MRRLIHWIAYISNQVGRLFHESVAAAFSAIEKVVEATEATWFRYTDQSTGPLGSTLRLLRAPFAPFVYLFRLFAFVAEWLSSKAHPLVERSEWIFGGASTSFGKLFGHTLKILRTILGATVGPLLKLVMAGPVGRALRWIARKAIPEEILKPLEELGAFDAILAHLGTMAGDFVDAWSATRNWKSLTYSSPAWILGGGLILITVLGMADSADSKIAHYRSSLIEAVEHEDDRRRDLALARLAQLGDRQQEKHVFFATVEEAKRNGSDSVYSTMLELSQADGGLREAKLWIVEQILCGDLQQDNPGALKFAENLLTECSSEAGEDEASIRLNAELVLQRDGLSAGVDALNVIASRQAWAQARLMRLYVQYGHSQQAARMARTFIKGFQQRHLRRTHEQQMIYIEALLIAKDWGSLSAAIDDSERLFDRPPTCIDYVQAVISRGITLDRNLACTLYRLNNKPVELNMFLGTELADGNIEIAKFVETQKSRGHVSPLLFRAAGDCCYRKSARAEAIDFYRDALAIDKNNAAAWNNVAWIESEMGNLEEALEAASTAVAIKPHSDFLETRGQIHARMSRWNETVEDLERALNGSIHHTQLAGTHATLATAYTALGEAELAAAHKARAQALESRAGWW